MRIATISIILITALSFSTVLVSDDFSDGNADGWFELPSGASYSVESGRYCFTHTAPDTAWAGSLNSDLSGVMSVSDYSCRVNAILNEGEMIGIIGRGNVALAQGYGLFMQFLGSDSYLILVKIEGIGQGQLLDMIQGSFSQGQEYWLRLEMSGDLIGAKYWTGNVGDEPGSWNLTATDNSYQDPGVFVLFGYDSNSSGSATAVVSFDDIEITDETTLVIQNNSWASIKAIF